MTMKAKTKVLADKIVPLNGHVLIQRDEERKSTSGGIQLPNQLEIPVLTGRIIELPADLDIVRFPIQQYDKVIFRPASLLPVDLENDKVALVAVTDIVGVIKKQ